MSAVTLTNLGGTNVVLEDKVFSEFIIPKEFTNSIKNAVDNPEGAGRRIFMNTLIDVDGQGN